MTKEKEGENIEQEIGKAEFLNLLDEREDQLREQILSLQIKLLEVQSTRQKVFDAKERDMISRFYTTKDTIRVESTVKPKMGFK